MARGETAATSGRTIWLFRFIDTEVIASSNSSSDGKIACDPLVLWGQRGVVNQRFQPLELWQAQCAGQVTGQTLPAGHFIPEELPTETAAYLGAFFKASIP